MIKTKKCFFRSSVPKENFEDIKKFLLSSLVVIKDTLKIDSVDEKKMCIEFNFHNTGEYNNAKVKDFLTRNSLEYSFS